MPTGQEIETSVHEWWARSLKDFLEKHPDEVYFGLAAVCNPFNPSFFLCLGCDQPIHTRHFPNPHRSEKEQRDSPTEWCYESFDYDRNTAGDFDKHFSWLNGFCEELLAADNAKAREMFETFVEALMRAMIRVERELVEGSPRFSQPADAFVLFEDDRCDLARQRRQALKTDGRLEPGWSRVIPGMKG